MHHALTLVLVALLSGCFSPNASLSDEMPEDLPVGGCRDTGGDTDPCETSSYASSSGSTSGSSSGTGDPVDACSASRDCLGTSVCAAVWDPAMGGRGAFACEFACIPLLDETVWCSDDSSCCDPGATCTPRGYCVIE